MQIDLNIINQLIAVAVIVESMTELIKSFSPNIFTPQIKQYVALWVSMAIALVFKLSVFGTDNNGVLTLGIIFSGLIASRGSNYVHDLLDIFANAGDLLKSKTNIL